MARLVLLTSAPVGSWNVNVYVAGSEPVACFTNVHSLTNVVLASARTSVQPAGGATSSVAVAAVELTNATSWSPASTPAGTAGATVVVVPAATAPIERKAGSITNGSGRSSSLKSNSRVFPLPSCQRRPAGVTSSPAESKIATGAIVRSATRWVAGSTKPTPPSGSSRGVKRVSRRQAHVLRPTRRSTVRKCSGSSVPSMIASEPNGVARHAPPAWRVQRVSPAVRADSPTRSCRRPSTTRRPPSMRAVAVPVRTGAGGSARSSPSAPTRKGAGMCASWPAWRPATRKHTAAASAASPTSGSNVACPANAGRFEGRSSSLIAT